MENLTAKRTVARVGRFALRWTLLLLLTIGWGLAGVGTVPAQPPQPSPTPVKLKITIRSVISQDCMDWGPCDGASYYAKVIFDGALHSNIRQTSQWYGRDQIMPDWGFVWDTHSQDVVDVDVEIWDEDGFLRFDDDQLDLDPAPGQTVHARRLSFRVDINECIAGTSQALTGEATGKCGRVTSTGLEGGRRGTIQLDVEVETPPTAPGLGVRCLHSPIWLQPGDTVTVFAEALDGAAVNKKPVLGSDIEIWVDPANGPSHNCTGSSCAFQRGPLQGTSFTYACRVKKNGLEAWSGWRTAQVGNPTGNRAIPVLLTGPPASRIDIVLIPTRQTCNGGTCVNYTSALDQSFLIHARQAIREAFYSWDIHLRNQDGLNFWIATDTGFAADGQVLVTPSGWNSTYAFADAGVVLHENNFRDFASPAERIFTSEPYSAGTIVHEAGHSPFGLIDEYCCDPSYTERAKLPNVYGSSASCQSDIPNLLTWDPSRSPSDCRRISRIIPGGAVETVNWWVSDPAADDLMAGSGDRTPNASDARRIEWIYRACKESSCWDVRP